MWKQGNIDFKRPNKWKLWIVLIALNSVICLVLDVLLMVQLVHNWNWLHNLNMQANNGPAECSRPKYVAALNFNLVYCTSFFTMYCILDVVKACLLWPALMQKKLSECWCALQFFAIWLLIGQGLFSFSFLPQHSQRLTAFALFVLLWTAILFIIVVWHNREEWWQVEKPVQVISVQAAAVSKDPEVQDTGSCQGTKGFEVLTSESDVPQSDPVSPALYEGKEMYVIGAGSLHQDGEKSTPEIINEEVPLGMVFDTTKLLKTTDSRPLETINQEALHPVNATTHQSFELNPQQRDAEKEDTTNKEISKGGKIEDAIRKDTMKNQVNNKELPPVILGKNEGKESAPAAGPPVLASPTTISLNEESPGEAS